MTNRLPRRARPLDHLVLPVVDIETARARYESLGFTVAPTGKHPFGTENSCVFFADGSYLEPLGIDSREQCEEEARRGNVFVGRDQAFRFRRGDNGFAAVVFETQDADADHRQFRDAGLSAGERLDFSRGFRNSEGAEEVASFRLAFAADPRAPDAFVFTCQRVNMPTAGADALGMHENGVGGIRRIVAVEPNPSDFQYFIQEVANQRDVEAHSFGMDVAAANATLSILTPEGLEAFFGSKWPCGERGIVFAGVVVGCGDLEKVETILDRNGVAWRDSGGRIIVDPAPGQGAFLAFQKD